MTKQEYPGMAIGLLPGYDSDVSGCLFTKADELPSATGLLLYLNAQGRLDEAIAAVEPNGGKVLQAQAPDRPARLPGRHPRQRRKPAGDFHSR